MNIEVLCHSSIRIESKEAIIYSDPFKIEDNKKDADIIVITHSHYDHFSTEDIIKIKKEQTKILVTSDLLEKTLQLGFIRENIVVVFPNNHYSISNLEINTVPAYNTNKKFHPKENNWVGYILNLEDNKVYIAGDTDITEENKNIECDIALVPVGGTYTMTHLEAAELINNIKPIKAIPIHYAEIVGCKEDAIRFKEKVNNNIEVEIQI